MKRYKILENKKLSDGNYVYIGEHFQGDFVKWDDVKDKLDLSKFKRGEIPTEEFNKEDIEKVEGSPYIILGNCCINDEYIIDMIKRVVNSDYIINVIRNNK